MRNCLINEINLMRDQGMIKKEFFTNSLISEEDDEFDCRDFFIFDGGKITVCYEKKEKVMVVDYKYNSFHHTHVFFIELSDQQKSWYLIDDTIQLFANIHLGHIKAIEKDHTKYNLYLWKDKIKAEVFLVAYNHYFDAINSPRIPKEAKNLQKNKSR